MTRRLDFGYEFAAGKCARRWINELAGGSDLDAANASAVGVRVMRAPRIFVSLAAAQEIKAARFLADGLGDGMRDEQRAWTQFGD